MIWYITKDLDNSILCHGDEGCEYINEYGEYEVWRDPAYKKYVRTYGYHFSPKLAEYASKAIRNVDGTNHYWDKDSVVGALKNTNRGIPIWATECDMQYLANYQYSEHFYSGSVAKTESDILKITLDEVWSPDAYEGEPFLHYITDIMINGDYINFEEMI